MLLAIYWNETIVSPSFVACSAPHTKINECNLPVHNFINSISFEMAHNFSVGSLHSSKLHECELLSSTGYSYPDILNESR